MSPVTTRADRYECDSLPWPGSAPYRTDLSYHVSSSSSFKRSFVAICDKNGNDLDKTNELMTKSGHVARCTRVVQINLLIASTN